VDEPVLVRMGQGVGGLDGDVDRLADGQGAAGVERLAHGATPHQLHDDGLAALAGAGVERRDDVGVGQAGGRHGLPPEPGQERLVGGQVGQQHLHRDRPGEDRVLRLPHLGHAALGDPADQLVAVPDPVADVEPGVGGRIGGGRGHDGPR
jgi:hypothetical protein